MIDPNMPAGSGSNPQPKWRITRIIDTIAPTLTNPGERVKRVYFQLFDGTESYVDVPLQGLNAQAVNRAVDEHANQLIEILTLKSPEQY